MTISPFVSESCTHVGTVRQRNEDAIVERPDLGLWAVADGAGGHGAGDVASAAVAAALEAIPPGLSAAELLAQLRLRLMGVHAELHARAEAAGRGRLIATTVVALLARNGHYACLWAGDSRAYLLRDGTLLRLTRDHSLVQEMVDRGELAEEEAESHPQANIILRAVGANGALELDKVSGHIAPGDAFLLCSDGLFKALPESAIAARLQAGQGAAALVEAALAAGARDNVSAVALREGGRVPKAVPVAVATPALPPMPDDGGDLTLRAPL
ncbi:protein phosphatase 2C domain-containing protein [Roseomonas sp. OT10]|uniref:PP2C family protein-serine/threonine phosphatase n=1 Tax=Roseomonas cutis TaxID=2897332 RepID=UPI001E57143B|nr:protein phosphatase 2C domain-containing protein [Roseomonas sp. OT10]UFN47768.1 protein phosphatase 2C domain-containing protein [Roseomonas sp. OT10]